MIDSPQIAIRLAEEDDIGRAGLGHNCLDDRLHLLLTVITDPDLARRLDAAPTGGRIPSN